MELKQLEYFKLLYEMRNITKTAEKLYLSRPNLSLSIKHLENELGVPLFTRGKDGVVPTEYGEILYTFAKKNSKLWADCLKQIDTLKTQHTEVIRLGMPLTITRPEELQQIFAYEDMDPLVTIELIEDNSSDHWSMILNGSLDVGYTVRPPKDLPLCSIPLQRYEQSLVINKAHPLAVKEQLDFCKDLQGITLLEPEFRMNQYMDLLAYYKIKTKNIANDNNLVLALLNRNKGCVFLVDRLVDAYLTDKTCARPVINIPEELDLNPYLVYSPDASDHVKSFVEYFAKLQQVEVTIS